VATVFIDLYKPVQIMIRANLEVWEGGARSSEKPVVIYATCQSKGFPLGKFKQQDNVELESKLSCTHVKMEIDGVETLEVDFMNNIFKVNGEDRLAQYRANIGG
jgi:P2 family phage contractile tail tube protein